jgi:hypothetical protein
MSITSVPGRAVAVIPSGPKRTWSTASPSHSISTIRSAAAASDRGVSCTVTAPVSSPVARPGVRFQTCRFPTVRAMLAAIGSPIVPSPQNPTAGVLSFIPVLT